MKTFLAAALGFMLLANGASACSRVSDARHDSIIPQSGIDQSFLDGAIRNEVNYQRCRAGLRPLSADSARMDRVAYEHSFWMASTGKLSHRNAIAGKRTLGQRVKAAKVQIRHASENIAMLPRYRFGAERFVIRNASRCQFAYSNGKTVSAHSYASLSREVTRLWMASPGHKRNILDRRARRVSSVAVFGNSTNCGRFWITQNFVG